MVASINCMYVNKQKHSLFTEAQIVTEGVSTNQSKEPRSEWRIRWQGKNPKMILVIEQD